MPRKKGSRSAQGAGTIRQRKDGKWEARYTVGQDPGTGKQIQKSIYGSTQKEVLKKLQQVQADLENGTYVEPVKMTISQWMDIWTAEYLNGVKQSTQASYRSHSKNHIKPQLGSTLIQKLKTHEIQTFYNDLLRAWKSAKTVRNIHGTFHEALEQAVKLGYVKFNPTSACTLPRVAKKEMKVLEDDQVAVFLKAIEGDSFETIYYIDLFTGMRQGEILGLTWECVDFDGGTLLINKQLSKEKKKGGKYFLDTTKHDKVRRIKPAPVVMAKLREHKANQAAAQLLAGAAWSNHWNLVFTSGMGKYLVHHTVRTHYKRIVTAMGVPELRFHDLRHSYAVISLMSGDDAKTVSDNLGHHAAAFTLDTYAHVTERMKEDSANRMEQYIQGLEKA